MIGDLIVNLELSFVKDVIPFVLRHSNLHNPQLLSRDVCLFIVVPCRADEQVFVRERNFIIVHYVTFTIVIPHYLIIYCCINWVMIYVKGDASLALPMKHLHSHSKGNPANLFNQLSADI